MNMKKIAVFVLIGGGLIAAALYAFISFQSDKAAKEIESQINAKLTAALQYTDDIEFEPFVCSGGLNISCYSKRISASDGEMDFVLSDVGFDITSISTQAITLETKIKDIALQAPTPEDKEEQELLEILQRSIPNSLSCTLSFKHNDEEVFEKDDCLIKAKNAHYELKGDFIHKDKEFSGKNIAQLFTSSSLLDLKKRDENFYVKLNSFSFIAKDQGFGKDMRRDFEIESKKLEEVGSNNLPESYEEYARQVADTVNFFGNIIIGGGNAMANFAANFADGLEYYLVGKTDTIGFRFTAKPETPFMRFGDAVGDFPSLARQLDIEVITK